MRYLHESEAHTSFLLTNKGQKHQQAFVRLSFRVQNMVVAATADS